MYRCREVNMRRNEDYIAVYSRKSKFTGKGESIGNQIELCRVYIREHYGETAAENIIVYEDEGFSGGNLNRPGFRKMMNAAGKHKFRAIIVYRLDRISRNISDFAGLIEELSRLDIAFVSIKEQFDTGTPMGRAMMYIASVFSQLERETIAERIRDNMHELAKTGRWLGGTTPTGYASESVRNVTVDGKSRKACRLKLIPEEADIVKAVYALYIETDSLTAAEAELMKRGIKTKKNNCFSRFAIKGILQNPVYAVADQDIYDYFIKKDAELFSGREAFDGVHGILAYNRTDQEKGRAAICRPVCEWIISVGQHPGIIPGRVWVSVQESLERNKSKAYHKPRSNEALLTGLLYCSCGSPMYPKLSKRKAADGKSVYTYVCKMKERSKGSICSGKNVNGNTLDMIVAEQIKLLEEDKEAFARRLEQSRGFCAGHTDSVERLASLLQEKAAAEKKMEALMDSLIELEGSAARDPVAKHIGHMDQECRSLDIRIRELEEQISRNVLSEAELNGMGRFLSAFGDGMDEMTIEQKRAAFRTLIRKVVWDGVHAHVVLFGASEESLGEDSK